MQIFPKTWNSIVGIAIRAVFDFSITSFRLLKRVPRNGFLTRSNRKKSVSKVFTSLNPFLTQNLIQTRCCKFNSIFKTVKNRKYVQRCIQDGVTFTNVKLW